MKHTITALLLIIAFFILPVHAWSQWSLLALPPGGFHSATAPCVDSSHNLYIAATDGSVNSRHRLNKKELASNRWSLLHIDSAKEMVDIYSSLCLPNGKMVVASFGGSYGNYGVFWSADEGVHWTKEWTTANLRTINSLVYGPQGILLAATGKGIYLTDTTDTLWRKVWEDFPDSNDDDALDSIDYTTAYAAPNGYFFVISVPGDRVHRSTDSGKTWTVPDSVFAASCFFVNSFGILVAAGAYGGLYRSSDYGENWWGPDEDTKGMHVGGFYQSSNGNIYASTSGSGTWRSTNDGTTWNPEAGPSGGGADVLDVASGLIAGITGEGVFESSDKGDHWFAIDSGISVASVQSVGLNTGSMYVSRDAQGVIRTSDEGSTWQIEDSLPDVAFKFYHHANIFYAWSPGFIYRLDNNHWNLLPPYPENHEMSSMCIDTSGKLFASSTELGLFSLDESTGNWEHILGIMSVSLSVSSITCDSSNVLYARSINSIYRSKDDGESWDLIQLPGTDTVPVLIAANKDTLCMATKSALYRSRDHGTNWTVQPIRSGFANLTGLAFDDGLTFLYNTGNIIETESDTSSWQLDTGYAGSLTSITIGDNNIAYLGTDGNGIYSRALPLKGPSAVANRAVNEDPLIFYPNPATTDLNIISSDPSRLVHLVDMLGREVLTGMLSAPGQVTLDVSKIPRGIYNIVIDREGEIMPVGRVSVVGK